MKKIYNNGFKFIFSCVFIYSSFLISCSDNSGPVNSVQEYDSLIFSRDSMVVYSDSANHFIDTMTLYDNLHFTKFRISFNASTNVTSNLNDTSFAELDIDLSSPCYNGLFICHFVDSMINVNYTSPLIKFCNPSYTQIALRWWVGIWFGGAYHYIHYGKWIRLTNIKLWGVRN